MVCALSILRTTLFITRTFVLVQPTRAVSCICLPEEHITLYIFHYYYCYYYYYYYHYYYYYYYL